MVRKKKQEETKKTAKVIDEQVATEEVTEVLTPPDYVQEETTERLVNADSLVGYKTDKYYLEQGSKDAVGYDIRTTITKPMTLVQGSVKMVPTGIYFDMHPSFEAQVRPRSGMATKGITVVNSPGTIDPDYKGEVKVILTNLSSNPYVINPGDKIAQIVFKKIDRVSLTTTEDIGTSERGAGGFGHTGK